MSFAEFFARARTEAARYGPDPWIFVRELLQNARDAGATRVDLNVELGPNSTTVTASDDGEGMSFEHAKSYLFSLYASSKESDESSVGKFGVGFWSILRFEPDRMWIRSRAAGHEAWEIELAADSARAVQRRPALAKGTQIVLTKAGSDPQALRRLGDAVRQNARFLRQRDGRRPLEVYVQGQLQNTAFDLPAPVASFKTRGGRGVVALGAAPRVELFSNGLRVRAASCLEDLLSDERASTRARVRFPSVEGIMAPQVLIEADHIEPLLSRSDARDDAQLRRLVHRAQGQLRRLVRRQLDTLRPPGVRERVRELFRAFSEAPVWAQVSGAALFGALVAVALAPFVWPQFSGGSGASGLRLSPVAATRSASYRDLSADYHGPQVSELDPASAQRLDLRYAPADQSLFFGLLAIDDFTAQAGREAPVTRALYEGARCRSDRPDACVSIALGVDAQAGPMRVPLPAGYRLELESLNLDGRPLDATVARTTADEAVAMLRAPIHGELRYRAARAASTQRSAARARALPPELAAWVPELRRLSDPQAKVELALAKVKGRVRYAVDAPTANAHAAARARGEDFLQRALSIGAGDCDVQNGTLAAVLQAAGVQARLVVGVVGAQGRARPWLHAWLEYRDAQGAWRVADASEGATIPNPLPPEPASTSSGGGSLDDGGPTVAAATSGGGPEAFGGPSAATSGSPSTGGDAPAPLGDTTSTGPVERGGAPVAAPPSTASNSPANEPQPGSPGWLDGVRSAFVSMPVYVPAIMALAAGTLGLLMLLALLRTRQGRVAVNREVDLAHMLQGALRQPQAFRQLPELFSRRLIPQRRGRAISLMDARQHSATGKLFWASGETELARDAARRGCVVLDGERPEAMAVAVALGAIDLDALGELAGRAQHDPLLAQLERALAAQGARWQMRVVPELDRPIRSVDLRALDLARRYKLERIVYLHATDPVLVAARATAVHSPSVATFALLDDLFARLDLPDLRRAELLGELAREAIVGARHE